jgi:ribose transport system permease protein
MSKTDATPPPYAQYETGRGAPPDRRPEALSDQTPRASRGSRVMWLAEAYAVPALFVLVFLFFSTWGKTRKNFLTIENIQNVLGSQAIIGILALAIVIPLVCGEFDFSVGPIMGITQLLVAGFMANNHIPLPIALVAAVGVAALVGLSTGNTVARVGVNSLIVTLGLAQVLLGFQQAYNGGKPVVGGIDPALTSLGGKQIASIPVVVYILAVAAVLVWYLLEHTPYGRYLHSVGSNREAARLVGLRVERTVLLAFVISGTMAGIAGVLLVARTGTANALPDGGISQSIQALAAAYLGATAIKPGRYNVPGTIIAIFFLAFTVNGLVLAQVPNWITFVFSGAALFIGVLISTTVRRKRAGTA